MYSGSWLGGLLLPTYTASKKPPGAVPLLTMEGMWAFTLILVPVELREEVIKISPNEQMTLFPFDKSHWITLEHIPDIGVPTNSKDTCAPHSPCNLNLPAGFSLDHNWSLRPSHDDFCPRSDNLNSVLILISFSSSPQSHFERQKNGGFVSSSLSRSR